MSVAEKTGHDERNITSAVTGIRMTSCPSFWYVATPYSRYPGGISAAFREASRVTAMLMRAGIPVFCPIAHSHPVAEHGGIDAGDHKFWLPVDRPMMDAASGLIVVQMNGWNKSTGVSHEMEQFRQQDKPIVYLPWNDMVCSLEPDAEEDAGTDAAPVGQKRFSTGAVRSSDADNERYDLISPIGLRRLAETCREGADKYSDFNWEKGMPVREMLNHGIRHLYEYLSGNRDEDHLAHAAWNCFAAMHSEELWPDLNRGTLRGPNCSPPNEQADE